MKMFTGQKKLTTGNPIHLFLHSRQDTPSCIVRGYLEFYHGISKCLPVFIHPTISRGTLMLFWGNLGWVTLV